MTFNFQDIFQSSFLEYTGAISMLDMALALALSFALGLFIFLSIKNPTRGSCTRPALA